MATELEKQNLEAHVDLCEQRYKNPKLFEKIEEKVESIHEDIQSGNKSMVKVIIGATGTIVAGLRSHYCCARKKEVSQDPTSAGKYPTIQVKV